MPCWQLASYVNFVITAVVLPSCLHMLVADMQCPCHVFALGNSNSLHKHLLNASPNYQPSLIGSTGPRVQHIAP